MLEDDDNADKPLLAEDKRQHSSSGELETSKRKLHYGTDEVKPYFERRKLLVVGSVLTTELCERLTYYSVIANIILFCTSTLKMSSNDATSVNLAFAGTVFIIPIFGGYVADAFAGRFNTIFGAGIIYIIGLIFLPASAVDYDAWFGHSHTISVGTRRAFFFSSLVLISIGSGGIKANVGPFGAQQVQHLGQKAVQSFFNWFYWFINVGAMIAYSGVAAVQQSVGFDVGFLIPLISMVFAMVVFVINKQSYITLPAGGSVIRDTVGVCCATKCKGFDHARKSTGGPYSNEMVDDVIAVLRILPIFLFVIMYWAIYSQMSSTFFLQAERMDIKMGSGSVPVAALNIFNTIVILILIPIMESLVYPCLEKINRAPSHFQRIGTGMVFASLSVFVAGVLEIYRKKDISIINQKLADDSFNASTISVFAQIPQFTLIGASEVFTSISGLEFAYSQAPSFMQGVSTGIFWATAGIGNYVSELILVIIVAATGTEPPDSWFPDDINYGQTEYLFFLLGVIMLANLAVFVIVAYMYKYRSYGKLHETRTDDERNDFNQEYTVSVTKESVMEYESKRDTFSTGV